MMIESIEDGRKEDGNRAIADKIIKRLHDLEQTVENNQGRWAWELLQNAKDSIAEEDDRKVSVRIELNNETVEFSHNGTHFTELDIRGLVSQTSSKEPEEGQQTKKVGRFGTGFLTTHLLSKVIHIKGIVDTKSDGFCKFDFLLDRQGKTIKELAPKIENVWKEFQSSAQKIESDYDKNQFNTSFSYQLDTEVQKKIAKIGIEEFSKLIPFVLAFIPKISCVEIIDNITEKNTIFERQESIDNLIIPISKTENGQKTDILILHSVNDKVSIATEIENIETGYSIKSIKNLPKLFCDFPLIGTENFHFPVIINSFYFNPLTERDGIWLKDSNSSEVKENRELLENAVELYKNLIFQIEDREFFDFYNLVEARMPFVPEKYFDEFWYKYYIQQPIIEFISKAKIVELEKGFSKKSINELAFPLKSYSENIKDKVWQFAFDLYPDWVCKKSHLYNWCEVSWSDCKTINYKTLVNILSEQNDIFNLSKLLRKDESNTFDWLNSFYNFILEDDSNMSLFEWYKIIPNQYGVFLEKSELFIDKIQNKELLNILSKLGDDWKNILLNKRVNFGSYRVKKLKNIADEITERINQHPKNTSFNEAISLLSEWFDNNPKLGEELFSELYGKRAELFMNIIEDKESLYKVMRSPVNLTQLSTVAQTLADNPKLIQKISELDGLLKEFNISEVSELKDILKSAQNSNVDKPQIIVTKEVLLSLGITSTEEFNEAFKDKLLSSQFIHTSTPTPEMFEYVQGLIKRTKENVIKHLKTLSDYNCEEWEELATTVIGGIKKQGLPVHIVVRPSDNGQVIVYYTSEKDALDYENAELWIDNGIEKPRHLTLGKILKKTGINRIPV
ncbi:hypothetical protein BROC_00596 [Candidatus Brocadiaceae bacterium]|nr:hypothetical protein BROC_00596 [Candidatus Brocadiaceae bacterium]